MERNGGDVKLLAWLHDPQKLRRFHATATVIWLLLIVPTLIFWSQSVLWVALMSIWANVAGHWSAWQATRAEEEND
jgi:hypothetical protein